MVEHQLVSDKKNCLEKLLGTSVSKHSEMANSIIESADRMKIGNKATTVEERLKRRLQGVYSPAIIIYMFKHHTS